jgi:hypothetical protein
MSIETHLKGIKTNYVAYDHGPIQRARIETKSLSKIPNVPPKYKGHSFAKDNTIVKHMADPPTLGDPIVS